MKMRPLFWVIGLAALVVLVVLVLIVPIFVKLKRYQAEEGRVGTIYVDLSKVPDGVYAGSYDSGPVVVQVKVTVSNHAMTKIDLVKHRHGRGSAAEVITEKVIQAQSLKVDTISGATMSSKVILLAIEDALKGR